MVIKLAPGPQEACADTGVIVPVFNGVRWLATALRSLQAQTFADWVAIVVDDGSTDSSAELAETLVADDPRFRIVRQDNRGVAAARQRGINELPATVRLVAFLDADDRYEPSALAQLRNRLQQRSDAAGAYCLARYVDEVGHSLLPGRHEAVQQDRRVLIGRRVVAGDADTDLGFASLVLSNAIWPAAVVLLRIDMVREVGGPDPTFRVQEDWELYLRLSRRGPFVPLPQTLVDYRRHDANATAATSHHDFQQDRMWHKAWRSPANTTEQRRTVSRAWRWLQLRQAREHIRQLGQAVRRRDPAAIGRILAGVALCAGSAALPGPPPARPRVSSLMHALPYPWESWQQ